MSIKSLPVRFCVTLLTEGGRHVPYCIACTWRGRSRATQEQAKTAALRHCCPKPKEVQHDPAADD